MRKIIWIHVSCQKRSYAKKMKDIEFSKDDVTLCMHCGMPIVCTGFEPDDDWNGYWYVTTYGAVWKHEGEREGSCKRGDTGAYPFNAR